MRNEEENKERGEQIDKWKVKAGNLQDEEVEVWRTKERSA